MSNELQTISKLDNSIMCPDKFEHYWKVANALSKSTMIPKSLTSKPMDIMICMDMGYQLGLPLMQSLQDIAVINGKPCMYGDGLLAVTQGHPDYEWIREEPLVKEKTVTGYSCTIKRKNHEPHTSIFTMEDAKRASLLGKPGPWSQYPARMMQMRARGFAIRNTFADALRGIKPAEEVMDYTSKEHQPDTIDAESSSQTEKLKSLINAKQGVKHEDDKEIPNGGNNDNPVIDAEIEIADIAQETIECEEPEGLDKTGESENIYDNSTDTGEAATDDQIDLIQQLIHESGFTPLRLRKALNHYKVAILSELTANQAENFIEILNKE